MTAPNVLKRFLARLPEFYKQEGTYNVEGFTETGRLFYNDIDEGGFFTSPELEISAKGRHLEVDLLITGHVNYKLSSILVQEEKRIRSIISEVEAAHQIDNVDGISLDRMARIFDLTRGDWTDEEFRVFIKSAVTGLIGGGTAPNLKAALSITIGIPISSILITDVSAAHFRVEVPERYVDVKPELVTVITKYKSAGVSFELQTGYRCVWDLGLWNQCTWI